MQFYSDPKEGMQTNWQGLPAVIQPGHSLLVTRTFWVPKAGDYTLQYQFSHGLELQISQTICRQIPWRRSPNPEVVLTLEKGTNLVQAQILNHTQEPIVCNFSTRLLDSHGQLLPEDFLSPLPAPTSKKEPASPPDLTGYIPAAGVGFQSCGRFGFAKGDGLLDYSMPAFGIISRPFLSGHPKYRNNLLWNFSLLPEGEQETCSLSNIYHVPENETIACDWTHVRWTRHLAAGGHLTFDYSVIAPALLIETDLTSLTLSQLTGIGAFRTVTLPLATGALTRNCQDGLFYDRKKDGSLSQNWVLLSRSGQFPEVPVLLTFRTCPSQILQTDDTVTIVIGNEHRQHYLFRVVFPHFEPCVRLSPHTALHRELVDYGNLLSNDVRIAHIVVQSIVI